MFKRRRSADESHDEIKYASDSVESDLDEVTEDEVTEMIGLDDSDSDDLDDELDENDEDDDESSAPTTNGPFDEADVDDDLERLDLGALRILPSEDVEIRLEIEEATGAVQAVTLVAAESVMQVGVFAAPRTEGIWDEVRSEIAGSISTAGGTVDHVEGEFGAELRAKVQAEDDQGRTVVQPVRFIGVDGPRWFLRGLLSGQGVDDAAAAAPLMDTFRGLVVVRGTDPMAPHEPLPIHLPIESTEDDAPPEAAGHELNPFRRGPEITEIR